MDKSILFLRPARLRAKLFQKYRIFSSLNSRFDSGSGHSQLERTEAVRQLCPGSDAGGAGDERDAERLVNIIARDPACFDVVLERARSEAAALVRQHERVIKVMAAALLERGELDARAVRDIYFAATHPAAAQLIADCEGRASGTRRGPHWRSY